VHEPAGAPTASLSFLPTAGLSISNAKIKPTYATLMCLLLRRSSVDPNALSHTPDL
jgi:hypothetical protein